MPGMSVNRLEDTPLLIIPGSQEANLTIAMIHVFVGEYKIPDININDLQSLLLKAISNLIPNKSALNIE